MSRKTSEELIRKEMIDPSKVKIEITACPDALFGVDGYDAEPWNEVSDYCLYRENGEVLVLSFVEGLAVVQSFYIYRSIKEM